MRAFSIALLTGLVCFSLPSFATDRCANEFKLADADLVFRSNQKMEAMRASGVNPYLFIQSLRSELRSEFVRVYRDPGQSNFSTDSGSLRMADLGNGEVEFLFESNHSKPTVMEFNADQGTLTYQLANDFIYDSSVLQNLQFNRDVKFIVRIFVENDGRFAGPTYTQVLFGLDYNQRLVQVSTIRRNVPQGNRDGETRAISHYIRR